MIATKGTDHIVSEFRPSKHFENDWSQRDPQVCTECTVDILKMIGPEGTPRFVQCVQFCTVWTF